VVVIMDASTARRGSRDRQHFEVTTYDAYVTAADAVTVGGTPADFEFMTLDYLLGKELAASACESKFVHGQDSSCRWLPWPPVDAKTAAKLARERLPPCPLAGPVELRDPEFRDICRSENLTCVATVTNTDAGSTVLCLADGSIPGLKHVGFGREELAHLPRAFLHELADQRRWAYLVDASQLQRTEPAAAAGQGQKRKRDDAS
jgi:hypothetical protein